MDKSNSWLSSISTTVGIIGGIMGIASGIYVASGILLNLETQVSSIKKELNNIKADIRNFNSRVEKIESKTDYLRENYFISAVVGKYSYTHLYSFNFEAPDCDIRHIHVSEPNNPDYVNFNVSTCSKQRIKFRQERADKYWSEVNINVSKDMTKVTGNFKDRVGTEGILKGIRL